MLFHHVHAQRRRRRIRVSNDREVTRTAIEKISAALHASFLKLGETLIDDLWPRLEDRIPVVHAASADKNYLDEAAKIADALDLDDLESVVPTTAEHLILVGRSTAADVLDQLGIDSRELGRQADMQAVDLANNRAAELVGKKHSGSGELVDNADAKFAIDQTTRDALRDTIADGFERHATVDEIASDIVGSTALSQERAELIARTEVFNINNDTALASFKIASDQGGVALLKEWNTTSDEPCESCLENESAGPIPLDSDFPGGDDAPTLHPRCSCELSVVIDESEDQDGVLAVYIRERLPAEYT
jgi:hypothetical protein